MSNSMKPRLIWQRIVRGYDDYDVYDVYGWFINTFPKILDTMADTNTYTYPQDFKGVDDWNQTIREIAALFRESDEINCSKQNEYMKDYCYRKFELGDENAVLDPGWSAKEKEITKYRSKCLKDAFKLLEKHIERLWI